MKRTSGRTPFIIASLLIATAVSTPVAAKVLDVTENTQQVSQWCWAAVSRTMLAYYRVDAAQCDIAEYTRQTATWHNYGTSACCSKPTGLCNYWNYLWGYDGSVQDILVHFGNVASEGKAAPLTLEESIAQIDARKPFIIRWGLDNGGGHFVVGHGAETDGTFYYMDPWFGEGFTVSTYTATLSSSGHEWTHTAVMTAAPCDCHSTDECCDGCMPKNEGGACDADGSGCTSGDSCAAGTCLPGPAPDCTAWNDQCNSGICISTGADTYSCEGDPAPAEGQPCNADDDGCTAGDSCAAGLCVPGPAPDCSASAGPCVESVCLSQGPSAYACAEVTSTMDGLPCNDLNPCTTDDICGAGVCAGSTRDCSDGFACTLTWCDPESGECVVEVDDTVCDDADPCTRDQCLAESGCANVAIPDWHNCNGPGFACFSGRCETLAANDTFETATPIEEGLTYYAEYAALHQYLTVPAGCLDDPVSGHDAFYMFRGQAGQTYTLTLTPDEGVLAALAVWNGLDEEASCTSGINVATAEQALALPFDQETGIILQLVIVDVSNATGPTGVTLRVNMDAASDQAPEWAEPDPGDAWADSQTPDILEPSDPGNDQTIPDDYLHADALVDTVTTDAQVSSDTDSQDPPDADAFQPDTHTTETTVIPDGKADGHVLDATARDTLPPDRDGDGSGCTATNRGALPATASLLFLMAFAIAIAGLARLGRRRGRM